MSTNEANEAKEATNQPAPGAATARRPAWAFALLAGLLATGLSWAAGEAAYDRFNPGTLADPEAGPFAGGVSREAVVGGLVKDAMLTYGVQGAILGLLLGLAGAASGGSRRSATVGAIVGLSAGAVLGAVGSMGIFWFSLTSIDPDPRSGDLLVPLLAHTAVWGLVGGAGGLSFGLGMGGTRSRVVTALLGGLVGAAIGAVAYEIVAAILFAGSKTDQPVPDATGARLLAHSSTNLLAALGAAMALTDSRRPKKR